MCGIPPRPRYLTSYINTCGAGNGYGNGDEGEENADMGMDVVHQHTQDGQPAQVVEMGSVLWWVHGLA